jgi:hypothetical protein
MPPAARWSPKRNRHPERPKHSRAKSKPKARQKCQPSLPYCRIGCRRSPGPRAHRRSGANRKQLQSGSRHNPHNRNPLRRHRLRPASPSDGCASWRKPNLQHLRPQSHNPSSLRLHRGLPRSALPILRAPPSVVRQGRSGCGGLPSRNRPPAPGRSLPRWIGSPGSPSRRLRVDQALCNLPLRRSSPRTDEAVEWLSLSAAERTHRLFNWRVPPHHQGGRGSGP